jgi:glycine/D-amino acid oxidase-like deaminating enzyme
LCQPTTRGILNGPATGLALAELIADGHTTSVDIAAFDPERGGHDYAAV